MRSLAKQTESVSFTDDAATVAALQSMLEADIALAGRPIDDDFVDRDLAVIPADIKSTGELLLAQF